MLTKDPSPFWQRIISRIVTLVMVCVLLLALMWFNASNFDETEIRTLIPAVLALAGREALHMVGSKGKAGD